MKRRTDCSKFRRPIKKSKIAEGLSSNTLLYLKFFILWAFVIAADHLIEFRFEFLWPFWLLLRSVHDSFKYKGLAFSILFVCIAFTSDLICLFFIPAQWLFFVASTYVWVQFVWHTDRGVCLPTIVLWVIFVYLEAAVRWKDNRSMPHLDLCRPFAAHCIGYPVVTLGFGFKSYVGYRIRQRKQREVAKENDFYMQLLQQALPQEETMPSFSQSDQQLQPQEKDPITVTGNHHQQSSSSGIPSSSSNHHHKNAQNNSSKLLNNNNNSSSPVTNGHAIGAAASLLFGLSSSMSSSSHTNSSSSSSASTTVISNGVGYNHSTQQISNPSSSSNSNSSSSSSSTRHRKSVDKESSSMMMTSSLSNNSNGGSNGTGGNKNNNSNTFHHISLNNKDRSNVNDNSSTSYDYSSQQNKQTHDKDSPKQQLNSHHYQLSNNSTTNVSNSSYDDAFGKPEPTTKSSNKLQNGNLQHYTKQDFELPQSTCQQQQQPEQILCNNNSQSSVGAVTSNEKERTKSGRKGRGNKGNKNPIDPTTSASSSKDNHLQTSSLTTVTNHNQQNNTTSSNVNNNNINNNTQQDSLLFQSQYSLCNNKDHQNKVCESCPKFEVEVKKLKAEINALKQSEIELRQKSETNASNVKS
uniref:Macoilin n=1 Tax=Culicoides sonorensis TaxID=179676 RepID=A0A336LT64_CULSO